MPCESVTVVRLSGDICVKARKTRSRFLRRLAHNIRDALVATGLQPRLRTEWSRFFVDGHSAEALDALARVFGVQSISPAVARSWSHLGDVVNGGRTLFGDSVRGKRFAIRARRVGDPTRIPFLSTDVEREMGTALLPDARRVDLERPEFTARVEIHPDRAFFFDRTIAAPAGLPVGVEGRALALVSGGFDSAVAAWLMLKRGVALDYLFFNLAGTTHEQGALRVIKIIADCWSYGDRPRMYVIDLRPSIAELKATVPPRYWQVVLKRTMLRAAEILARNKDLPALVTGEAVGQVSSQTLSNLAAISRAVELPVLRPLLGFNKEEILRRARAIGTHDLSAAVAEVCDLLPPRPATRSRVDAVAAEERRLDPLLLERLVAARRRIDLRGLELGEASCRELEVERIPPGAVVLDLRSPADHQRWRCPGALAIDYGQALRGYRSFDRDHTYVLYCQFGLKSAHLAEVMQRDGFDAYHVRGGVRGLRQALGETANPVLISDR